MRPSNSSTFLHHEPCPSCGSSNAGARYSSGDLYCFRCEKTIEKGDGSAIEETTTVQRDWTPAQGECVALPKRSLTKETCEKWRYEVGTNCQIANYYDDQHNLVAQKVRLPGKEFHIIGDGKNIPLYGQWKFSGGRHLVITEGELDALSVSQAFDNKYPVVSLPTGAPSAEKAIKRAYEWLDKFERIVLMFDEDEAGRDAVEKVAPLLPAGKVGLAKLPEKDANDVLVRHGPGPIVRAFWDAPIWRPDGIVDGATFTLDMLKTEAVKGYELPYPKLQAMILGLRKGELTLLTAGSGIGKSTVARELAYHLHQTHGQSIGNVFLEEGNVKTGQAYVAIDHSVPLGRLRHNPALLTDEQWQDSITRIVNKRMWFFNHFGSLESKNLISRITYLAKVCAVDFIVLDHISIATSGIESSSEGERKDIDILMTRLRSVCEATGVGIVGIVHLKRTDVNFNEGGQISLRDLRGSGSLEQLSDNVVALERDQQSDTDSTKVLLRVLKCRELGETGPADWLNYDRKTGRYVVTAAPDAFQDDEDVKL